MLRSGFERDLKEMHDNIIAVGGLLELAISNITTVLNTQDEEAVKIIYKCEREVDDLEKEIQSNALRLICFQQPVARDLRAISAALNMVTDMERIADQTVDIAEISMLFKNRELVKKPVHILEMIDKCIIMINKSITSFINDDVELAKIVIDSDDEVDNLFLCVRDEVISLINKNQDNGEDAIDLVMISKYLERIADHAVNIAEWVIFNVTGDHKNNHLM